MDTQGPVIVHDSPLDDARTARRIRWFARRRLVLLTTVVVIPIVLSLALNSWGALTVEGAWRMAVATVIGQTITICGAIIAVVLTIVQRRPAVAVVAFALLAAVIVLNALSTMNGAGQVLLDRLDLIAEAAAVDR